MQIRILQWSGFLVLIWVLCTSGVTVVGQDTDIALPLVGEDDVYIKDVFVGENESFFWTVFVNGTGNFAVSVGVSCFTGWTQVVSPRHFVLSEENPYEVVTVTVSVPQFPSSDTREFLVSFAFRPLNSSQIYVIEKTVIVHAVGVGYAGEENTILGGFPNPLPAPLDTPYGALLLNILLWFVIALVIYGIIRYIFHELALKTKTKLDDAIVAILRTPVIIVVLLYGVVTSVMRLGLSIMIREALFQVFHGVTLGIVIYVIYKIFAEILEEIAARRGGKKTAFARVLKPVFQKIGAVIIIIGGLIYGLSVIGVEITALLAGAGVFGLVIAFAAQDTLSNFFSGLHLLLDRPFHIGDVILLESGEYCRVESVGMRSTKLYSLFDHELIVLPNNMIANQRIVNIVRPDMKIKNRVEVGVAYGSDVEKVKKILYDAAMHHPHVVMDDGFEPLVRFTGFGDSSLDFLLIFSVDDVMNQWKTRSDIISEIDRRFRAEGVTIPFPQRTVWFTDVTQKKLENEQ